MSVEIKFEPDGATGTVAEGTSLLDGARHLGFQIPDCGVCDGTCAVSIIKGKTLLSPLSDKEKEHLSPARLAAGERLACQCKAERSGKLIIRLVAQTGSTSEQKTRELRRDFSELPFDLKIATLMQLETVAAAEAFDKIATASASLGKKIFDSVLSDDPPKSDQRTPPEKEKTV